MEHEAKQNLLARLDECLLEHAKALSSGDGMPDIADVYKLQDLSELHYYLKAEHVFTPAEVEALLQFKDPLDVARWCKEENTHKHSFPICELLQEIKAYQRFPLSDASVAPSAKKPSLHDRLQNAARKAAQHPAPEGKPRDDGER